MRELATLVDARLGELDVVNVFYRFLFLLYTFFDPLLRSERVDWVISIRHASAATLSIGVPFVLLFILLSLNSLSFVSNCTELSEMQPVLYRIRKLYFELDTDRLGRPRPMMLTTTTAAIITRNNVLFNATRRDSFLSIPSAAHECGPFLPPFRRLSGTAVIRACVFVTR